MKKSILTLCAFAWAISIFAQDNAWQQQADYQMDVTMNVKNFQYKGVQKLTYTNNSPDTLSTVFFHLYYNAFQPNSEMDANLQNLPDPDSRMTINKGTRQQPVYESRIAKLAPNEIGYLLQGAFARRAARGQQHRKGDQGHAAQESIVCTYSVVQSVHNALFLLRF